MSRLLPVRLGAKTTYPWQIMVKGDRFIFPSHITENNARGLAKDARKRLSRQFRVHKAGGLFYCWRV